MLWLAGWERAVDKVRRICWRFACDLVVYQSNWVFRWLVILWKVARPWSEGNNFKDRFIVDGSSKIKQSQDSLEILSPRHVSKSESGYFWCWASPHKTASQQLCNDACLPTKACSVPE
jgi:hypothetical protein